MAGEKTPTKATNSPAKANGVTTTKGVPTKAAAGESGKKVMLTSQVPALIGTDTPKRTLKADPTKEYVSGGAYYWLTQFLRTLPHYIDDVTRDFGDDLYDRMLQDPKVSQCMEAVRYDALSQGLTLSPAVQKGEKYYDKAVEIRDFCQRVLDAMETPLIEEVLDPLMDAVAYGNAVAEKIYHVPKYGPLAGYLTLKAIKHKPRRSYAFVVDAYNNIAGLLGRLADEFSPMLVEGAMVSTSLPNFLPRDKFVIARFRPRGGDPRGRSLLRPAYTPWWLKQQGYPGYLKFMAQWATPSLIGTTGENAAPEQEIDPDTGEPLFDDLTDMPKLKTPEQAMAEQLAAFQSGSYLVVPFGSTVTPIEIEGAGSPFGDFNGWCDSQMELAITLQALATSEGTHMARAAAEVHQDTMGFAVQVVKGTYERLVERDMLRQIVELNFGEKWCWLTPKASLSETEQHDFPSEGKVVADLWENGYLDVSQLPEIDARLGLPERSEEDIEIRMQKAQAVAAQEIAVAQATVANPMGGGMGGPGAGGPPMPTTPPASPGGGPAGPGGAPPSAPSDPSANPPSIADFAPQGQAAMPGQETDDAQTVYQLIQQAGIDPLELAAQLYGQPSQGTANFSLWREMRKRGVPLALFGMRDAEPVRGAGRSTATFSVVDDTNGHYIHIHGHSIWVKGAQQVDGHDAGASNKKMASVTGDSKGQLDPLNPQGLLISQVAKFAEGDPKPKTEPAPMSLAPMQPAPMNTGPAPMTTAPMLPSSMAPSQSTAPSAEAHPSGPITEEHITKALQVMGPKMSDHATTKLHQLVGNGKISHHEGLHHTLAIADAINQHHMDQPGGNPHAQISSQAIELAAAHQHIPTLMGAAETHANAEPGTPEHHAHVLGKKLKPYLEKMIGNEPAAGHVVVNHHAQAPSSPTLAKPEEHEKLTAAGYQFQNLHVGSGTGPTNTVYKHPDTGHKLILGGTGKWGSNKGAGHAIEAMDSLDEALAHGGAEAKPAKALPAEHDELIAKGLKHSVSATGTHTYTHAGGGAITHYPENGIMKWGGKKKDGPLTGYPTVQAALKAVGAEDAEEPKDEPAEANTPEGMEKTHAALLAAGFTHKHVPGHYATHQYTKADGTFSKGKVGLKKEGDAWYFGKSLNEHFEPGTTEHINEALAKIGHPSLGPSVTEEQPSFKKASTAPAAKPGEHQDLTDAGWQHSQFNGVNIYKKGAATLHHDALGGSNATPWRGYHDGKALGNSSETLGPILTGLSEHMTPETESLKQMGWAHHGGTYHGGGMFKKNGEYILHYPGDPKGEWVHSDPFDEDTHYATVDGAVDAATKGDKGGQLPAEHKGLMQAGWNHDEVKNYSGGPSLHKYTDPSGSTTGGPSGVVGHMGGTWTASTPENPTKHGEVNSFAEALDIAHGHKKPHWEADDSTQESDDITQEPSSTPVKASHDDQHAHLLANGWEHAPTPGIDSYHKRLPNGEWIMMTHTASAKSKGEDEWTAYSQEGGAHKVPFDEALKSVGQPGMPSAEGATIPTEEDEDEEGKAPAKWHDALLKAGWTWDADNGAYTAQADGGENVSLAYSHNPGDENDGVWDIDAPYGEYTASHPDGTPHGGLIPLPELLEDHGLPVPSVSDSDEGEDEDEENKVEWQVLPDEHQQLKDDGWSYSYNATTDVHTYTKGQAAVSIANNDAASTDGKGWMGMDSPGAVGLPVFGGTLAEALEEANASPLPDADGKKWYIISGPSLAALPMMYSHEQIQALADKGFKWNGDSDEPEFKKGDQLISYNTDHDPDMDDEDPDYIPPWYVEGPGGFSAQAGDINHAIEQLEENEGPSSSASNAGTDATADADKKVQDAESMMAQEKPGLIAAGWFGDPSTKSLNYQLSDGLLHLGYYGSATPYKAGTWFMDFLPSDPGELTDETDHNSFAQALADAQHYISLDKAATGSASGKPDTANMVSYLESKKLADSNTNAPSHNKKMDAIIAAVKAGDAAAIANMPFGTNTYAKKQVAAANRALDMLGVTLKVMPGQKANSHTMPAAAPFPTKVDKSGDGTTPNLPQELVSKLRSAGWVPFEEGMIKSNIAVAKSGITGNIVVMEQLLSAGGEYKSFQDFETDAIFNYAVNLHTTKGAATTPAAAPSPAPVPSAPSAPATPPTAPAAPVAPVPASAATSGHHATIDGQKVSLLNTPVTEAQAEEFMKNGILKKLIAKKGVDKFKTLVKTGDIKTHSDLMQKAAIVAAHHVANGYTLPAGGESTNQVNAAGLKGIEDTKKAAEEGNAIAQAIVAKLGPTSIQGPKEKWANLTPEQILHQKGPVLGGSNSATLYTTPDGQKHAVKKYSTETQAAGEALANKILYDLGIPVPKSTFFAHNGSNYYAGEYLEGSSQVGLNPSKADAQAFLQGWVANAFLGNWDAIGLSGDNIVKGPDGKVVQIDNGGSLLHSAMGGLKNQGQLANLHEWDNLGPKSSINPAFVKYFKAAGYNSPEQIPGVLSHLSNILQVPTEAGGWAKYVDEAIPKASAATRKKLADLLEMRSGLIAAKRKDIAQAIMGGTPEEIISNVKVFPSDTAASAFFSKHDAKIKAVATTGQKEAVKWWQGINDWHSGVHGSAANWSSTSQHMLYSNANPKEAFKTLTPATKAVMKDLQSCFTLPAAGVPDLLCVVRGITLNASNSKHKPFIDKYLAASPGDEYLWGAPQSAQYFGNPDPDKWTDEEKSDYGNANWQLFIYVKPGVGVAKPTSFSGTGSGEKEVLVGPNGKYTVLKPPTKGADGKWKFHLLLTGYEPLD
jgi:hypothetical protein